MDTLDWWTDDATLDAVAGSNLAADDAVSAALGLLQLHKFLIIIIVINHNNNIIITAQTTFNSTTSAVISFSFCLTTLHLRSYCSSIKVSKGKPKSGIFTDQIQIPNQERQSTNKASYSQLLHNY